MDIAGVRRLAALSKLRLTTDQENRTCEQIERLLEAFAVLQDAPTEGIEPSPYPMPIPHRLRADAPEPELTQDEALQNAPEQSGGCFRVPRVVDG